MVIEIQVEYSEALTDDKATEFEKVVKVSVYVILNVNCHRVVKSNKFDGVLGTFGPTAEYLTIEVNVLCKYITYIVIA